MTARHDPSHLVVGFLQRAHGIKGEIFVTVLTDHPESTFAPGVILYPGGQDADEPDPDLPPLRVAAIRPFQRGFLVSFGGVDDRSQAEILAGHYLFQGVEDLEPLEEGEVFHHQLLGLTVCTPDGREVGTVSQVFELQPADLLEVRMEEGSVMVPFRKEMVTEVDLDAGRLVIDPPEGLLELES